jgi:hypothetical protein
MDAKKVFQKRVENFACEHCGLVVKGNGYTNHCPHCLYSKHVDVFPGDRLESCGGLMEPIAYEKAHGRESIVQRCLRCGKTHRNRIQNEDVFEAILDLARKRAEKG